MEEIESENEHGAAAASDDVRTSSIAIAGLIGSLLVVVTILFLQVLYYDYDNREELEKDIDAPAVQLSNLVASQREKLDTYAWIDPQKKIAAIPIQRAMQRVVAELSTPAGPEPKASTPQPPGQAGPRQKRGPSASSAAGRQERSHAK